MDRRTFLLLAAAGLAGCDTAAPMRSAKLGKELSGPYRLDSGDRLRITVFEQAGLTNSYTVDQAGIVTFPLVGAVPARGRTTRELAASIATALQQGFLRDPDVTVEVETYRPFFIMGEVRTPGQYTYVDGLTVQTAIAIAGGFTPRASERMVELSRRIGDDLVTESVPLFEAVRPGDVIRVRQRIF